MKVKRLIVHFDEEKCDGCGLCVPACAEGAIQIIDGKARLVDERFCDGLGTCLGECPQGAITLEEREAEEYDEELVQAHLAELGLPISPAHHHAHEAPEPLACPSAAARHWQQETTSRTREPQPSQLSHWPVKIALLHPQAPYLQEADLLVVADCVPVAYGSFHSDFLRGRAVAIGCPKLDDLSFYVDKLAAIFQEAQPRSVTVVHMEVPCCSGLQGAVEQALARSGNPIPVEEVVIGLEGQRKA
ncbi:MAG TPA: 4Fe-4S ferredoxin [Armatimonadetes bacterium]|nr:4Fe-4S ferredoxin [Armatimonadota bacterium]